MLLNFLVVKDQDRGGTKGGLGGYGLLSSEHVIPQLDGEKLAFRKFFGYLVPW